MKALRLAVATGLVVGLMGMTAPAQANDCSDPKRPCGGCQINRNFSTEDLRPIVCYV
jgi:hypothetical protein